MNNTIDFNTAKTIGTMSKKLDHIDDAVSSFFSFMHMVNAERAWQCRAILSQQLLAGSGFDRDPA